MKTLLLLLLTCLPLVAQTTYPMLSTTTSRTVTGGATNLPTLTASNVFTGSINAPSYISAQQTVAYSSATNAIIDAGKILHFLTLTNTTYFAAPTNLAVGSSFTVILKQDATGARAVTFNTNYWKFPSGTQPTITTNAGAYSVLSCMADPYGTNVFSVSSLDLK